jgi:Protein of unknown function (DUF3306)
MNDPEENLLLRWSRRKAAARHAQAEAPARPAATAPAAEGQPAPADQPAQAVVSPANGEVEGQAKPAQPELRLEDLPDIETMTYDSDFTAFLREGVPEFLKRQALRKLWASNPILANLDGLNDYDPLTMTFLEQLEGAAEPIAEVGRGLRDKIMEAKRGREARPQGRRQPRSGQARVPDRPVAERPVEAEETAEAAPAEPRNSDV